jgi:hypothetical protein
MLRPGRAPEAACNSSRSPRRATNHGREDSGSGAAGGNAHQAEDLDAFKREQGGPFRAEHIGIESHPLLCSPAMLTWRNTLGKRPSFAGDLIGVGGKPEGIDGVDDLEEREDLAQLVALHPADEMPVQGTGSASIFG